MPAQEREPIRVDVLVLPHGQGLDLPAYETIGASGVDLRAAIDHEIWLAPMERSLIPTGLRIAIPRGFEGQVRSRSGMALQRGAFVVNSPGTVDSDYRGEIGVILMNAGNEPLVVRRGDRVAQLVVAPVASFTWVQRSDLPATSRGAGAYGHTGT